MKKYQEFTFEGIVIKVLSEFDETSNRYINEIPDFEEKPLYTPSGKPLVSAVQDRCELGASGDDVIDCGSCEFYQANNEWELIGLCLNPERKLSQ